MICYWDEYVVMGFFVFGGYSIVVFFCGLLVCVFLLVFVVVVGVVGCFLCFVLVVLEW